MILNAIESGRDDGRPPLVLIHGLFGTARNFGMLQRSLSATRRVIALDLRNHGDSPHASGMDYDTMAADVLETLAGLDALPCALMGHSMGGKVSMRCALRHSEAVARLLVSDIAPVRYDIESAAYARAMQAIPLSPGLTRGQAEDWLTETVPSRTVRRFLLQNLLLGAQPAWRIGLDEIVAGLPDIGDWQDPPAGSTYAGPTLFVAGAESDYILPEYRPAIRALFPAARFVTVKGAGHWVHADNPAGFLDVLNAFLAAL